MANPNVKQGDPLTIREQQAWELRRQGYPALNIAALMGISEDTAKHHISAVLKKAGCATSLELATNDSRKRDLRIKASHLTHQLSAISEELALLGESDEKALVIDFDARAGIALILSDMVQGCTG